MIFICIYIASLIMMAGAISTVHITEYKTSTSWKLGIVFLIAPVSLLYTLGQLIGKKFEL